MNTSTSRAIFVRNLVNYFASPTGYVFICLYVLLSSVAAFCPYEFFNSNLANLDQLNLYFPLIMLIFIPTITMSIWADERRQGTDELLLTIPASDLDIVLGKYLAAVAIFTIALLFSGTSNLAVLKWLGNPDLGLLATTHVGYWLIGITMLAVGMAGSFMTSNITVAFILGAVLNAPLVAAYWADALFGPGLADPMQTWSVGHQFADFGRGVISLSGVAYFAMIVAVMLYLCMVLIGQRHWRAPYSAALSWAFHLAIHGVVLVAFIGGAWLLFGGKAPANEIAKADAAAEQDGADSAKDAGEESVNTAATSEGESVSPTAETDGDLLASPTVIGFGALAGLILLYLILQTGILWVWHAALPQGIGATMPGHYLLRAIVLVIALGGVVAMIQHHDLRADVTSERLSSLSPKTRRLLADLSVERPVQIEAFISPKVPDSFVTTRLNLLTMLRELDALGGDKVHVTIRDTEKYSEEAARAEQLYGIMPRQVASLDRGVWSVEDIFLHVAVKCGLQKVDPVFYNRGIPPEYELVRSIATVSQQKRQRIGVVTTDVPLFGQFDFQTGSSTSDWPIIDELRKQYDVDQVDLTTPIPEDEQYDLLLAVQPSTLGPEQMDNFVAAIREGMPTAIFEDPMPYLAAGIPGTGEPRRSPNQMSALLGGSQQAPPKGDTSQLWDALGVIFEEGQVVWQDYNPYPQFEAFARDKEFVFVGQGARGSADLDEGATERESEKANGAAGDPNDVFNQTDKISEGLQQLLFPFPGSVRALPSSSTELTFTPLVRTGAATGTIPQNRILSSPSPFVRPSPDPRRHYLYATRTGVQYVLAAHIRAAGGNRSSDGSGREDAEAETPADAQGIHVVLTADIDMLTPAFFRIREEGDDPEADVHFDFDNVPFILNVVDVLAKADDFLELRSRRRVHRTLVRIETETEEAKEKTAKARAQFTEEFNKGKQREQDAFDKKIEDLRGREDVDPQQMLIEVALAQDVGQRRLTAEIERLERERDAAIDKIETQLNLETLRVQSSYKMRAALYPLVPPLFLGLLVFFFRRLREREGVDPARLR